MKPEEKVMTDHLYLVGDYEAAASIPIGATLARLEAEHDLLPAAFYEVFTTNLYKWMRVYDYLDAQEHAEMWMEDLSDEELEASSIAKWIWRSPPVSRGTLRRSNTGEPEPCFRRSGRTRAWLAN